MDIKRILAVSKAFLRTREGFWACPTAQGFVRLLDVTISLHKAFMPDGRGSIAANLAFRVWRMGLNIISGAASSLRSLRRL